MNVNFLGEAILGEEEARHRLLLNLQGLQAAEVEVISIKISTIYSQISPLARDHTVATLCDRLELLYRTAAHLRFTRPDGDTAAKFVYLDMEEYRDMDLTAEAFMRTLERPGWRKRQRGSCCRLIFPTHSPIRSGSATGPAAAWPPAGPPSPCGSSRAPTWSRNAARPRRRAGPRRPT